MARQGYRKGPRQRRRNAAGFSLLEVMIAVFVLGVGLLGFALMQTMNVRFAQSANHRTQVTNLTYELLDQMRVNRVLASAYVGSYAATTDDAACIPQTGANLDASSYRSVWECRLGKALGGGASATVSMAGDQVDISIFWGDERWVSDVDQVFSASTQL